VLDVAAPPALWSAACAAGGVAGSGSASRVGTTFETSR
jgi:hypothetical protein